MISFLSVTLLALATRPIMGLVSQDCAIFEPRRNSLVPTSYTLTKTCAKVQGVTIQGDLVVQNGIRAVITNSNISGKIQVSTGGLLYIGANVVAGGVEITNGAGVQVVGSAALGEVKVIESNTLPAGIIIDGASGLKVTIEKSIGTVTVRRIAASISTPTEVTVKEHRGNVVVNNADISTNIEKVIGNVQLTNVNDAEGELGASEVTGSLTVTGCTVKGISGSGISGSVTIQDNTLTVGSGVSLSSIGGTASVASNTFTEGSLSVSEVSAAVTITFNTNTALDVESCLSTVTIADNKLTGVFITENFSTVRLQRNEGIPEDPFEIPVVNAQLDCVANAVVPVGGNNIKFEKLNQCVALN